MVTLKEDNLPRGRWKLARIESLIESSVDGVHRAAVVVTSTGRRLKRPYRLIYPLEGENGRGLVSRSDNVADGVVDSSNNNKELINNNQELKTKNNSNQTVSCRSRRAAANAAREKIQDMYGRSSSESS